MRRLSPARLHRRPRTGGPGGARVERRSAWSWKSSSLGLSAFSGALEIRRIRRIFYSRLLKGPMTDRQNAQISSRKRPKQARSTDLVAAILEAAAQVLAKEGAPRFTTARVAERAGVSVGSIYQYFPNKAAILFRLQSDEWRQTSDLLRVILEDAKATAARTAARPCPRLHPLGMRGGRDACGAQ